MSLTKKIIVYLIGFGLGVLLLSVGRKDKPPRELHPWHEQTAPEGYYPVAVEDGWGRNLEFTRQPRYFISLAPSVTEILFAMDLGDHLRAVTDFCDYPEQARMLRDAGATVGRIDQPNYEAIAGLAADLIITTDLTPRDVVDRLHQPPRLNVLTLRHSSLDGLFDEIVLLGKVTGVPSHANRLLQPLRQRKAAVEAELAQVSAERPRKAVILLGLESGLRPGWSPGAGSWPSDLLRLANAENVAAGVGKSWGQLSLEALAAADPDVIFISVGSDPTARDQFDRDLQALSVHPVWSQITAVRNNRVLALPAESLNIPGPRMLDVLELLARGVWPEAYQ